MDSLIAVWPQCCVGAIINRVALAKTIEIQAAIDELYPMVEETLLAISSD